MQSGIDTSRSNTIQLASSGITRIDITSAQSNSSTLFGANGPSFRDVLDTINPLEHIPIVSNLFDAATGHTPSAASKLVGGALLGGPIGFVASLAGVIFQQETGHDVGGAMIAALSGSDDAEPTQVADATPAEPTADAHPQLLASLGDTTQHILTLGQTSDGAQTTAAPVTPVNATRNQAVLDLYGGSAASAHQSYQKVQMRPYLQDVNHTQIL